MWGETSDDDEALQAAIKASLVDVEDVTATKPSNRRGSSRLIVIEDSDTEDAVKSEPQANEFREPTFSDDDNDVDLKAAIALSLQREESAQARASAGKDQSRSSVYSLQYADSHRDEAEIFSPAKKKRKIDQDSTYSSTLSASTPATVADLDDDLTAPQLFYRLNYIPGLPKAGNQGTVSIVDIFSPGALRAILTTYKLDLEWLSVLCPDILTVPTELLHGESDLQLSSFILPSTLKVRCVKPSVAYGVFHGKIYVIEYPDRLRVAITTANLLEVDYHRKQQSIWMQDLPLQKGPIQAQSTDLAKDFLVTLTDYLAKCGLATDFLKKYDYSNIKVVLISSVPGFHKGNVSRYGHMKVRNWLSREPLPHKDKTMTESICMQCSSLGSLTSKWLLGEFMQSLGAGKLASPRQAPSAQLVWPTIEYVRNCIDGYMAGGSLCCNHKNMKDFMVPILRRYKPLLPTRDRIPPHIKTYFRYTSDLRLTWAMTTSANLSTGAWGQVQQNGQQIMIRNFEIGVLFLPSLAAKALNVARVEFQGRSAPSVQVSPPTATIGFPLPCNFPPEKYGPNERFWSWDIEHAQPDVFGQRWPPQL